MNAQHPVGEDVVLGVKVPRGLAVSPTGEAVVFSVSASSSERGSGARADLWMGDETGAIMRLSEGEWTDSVPVWSPDGSTVAFASDRAKAGHFLPYVLVPGQGEARRVAHLHGSVERIRWSKGGDRLLVQAADPGSYGSDWSLTAVIGDESEPDPITRRPGSAWRRLFLIDLVNGDVTEVGPAGQSVWEFDWDGSGAAAAVISDDPTGSGWYSARLVRLDLEARTATACYQPRWQLEGLEVSPDGLKVAVIEGFSSDRGLTSGSVMIVDLADGQVSDLWPALETAAAVTWTGDGSLWYSRFASTGTACGRLALDGGREEVWSDEVFIGVDGLEPACAVGPAENPILAVMQSHTRPPEVARYEPLSRTWRQWSTFNDALVDGIVFPEVRRITWRSVDDLEVHGRLLTPRGAAGALPLIVLVHGGPTWCWNSYFDLEIPNGVLLAEAGYAVLQLNPRGSTGRGHAFAQAVAGDPGGADLEDILAGVRHCVEIGVADPGRVGISGLSYGGFMSCWAPTQTDVFAAAVGFSVVADWVSQHLTADIAAFDEMFLGGSWHDPAGPHVRRSPVHHVRERSTPTLLIQGELDRCTPVGQAEEMFNALAEAGTETELVIYPREGHVPMEHEHVRDAIRRTRAWFDDHL